MVYINLFILRPMITAAFEWAKSHGLLRVNEVHKEEEARLVLSDTFELLDESGTQVNMEGSVEMEDPVPLKSPLIYLLAFPSTAWTSLGPGILTKPLQRTRRASCWARTTPGSMPPLRTWLVARCPWLRLHPQGPGLGWMLRRGLPSRFLHAYCM